MKIFQIIEDQLRKEPNYFTDEGKLKKWVVINKAQNFDEDLIGLLLENEETKKLLFKEIKGALVFNQSYFIEFLEQKNYLNDSYTKFKNKVGLTIDGKYLNQRNEVALVWPYKDCVLEGGQTKEEHKRDEIFFNEILAQDEITQLLEPKVLTNAKVYDKDGEQKFTKFNRDENGTIKDNLIIKGNNLLALHSLKKEFEGKIKLIYIDPPYNTGNDSFNYNDSFSRSTWLTFMRNRVNIALDLLKNSGLIFIHCDYNEDSYLRILLDEFDKLNFVANIAIRSSTPSGVKTSHKEKKIIKQKDTILVYSKGETILNPQYIKSETWDKHYSYYFNPNEGMFLKSLKEKLKSMGFLDNEIFNINNKKFKKFYLDNSEYIVRRTSHKNKNILKECLNNSGKILKFEDNFYIDKDMIQPIKKSIQKVFVDGSEFKEDISQLACDFWGDIDFQNTQNEGGISLTNGKKPEALLMRIILLSTNSNDIILDYHLGSGTTSAVAHKLGRQFIGIEQLNYNDNDSVKRMNNVINGEKSGISKSINWKGGGSFTYLELKKYNEEFIERIQEANNTNDLLNIWEEMKLRSFLNYNIDIKKQEEHIEDFKKLELKEQKQHLFDILDKNQLYVNLSSLEDKDIACTEEEKQLTKDFYKIEK